MKRKINGKIHFYSCCIDCGFKTFETIDIEELNDLLKVWTVYKTMSSYGLNCKKKVVKARGLQRKIKER